MTIVINATSVIFTRVILFSTKGNFSLAVVTHESSGAFALVVGNEVDAGGVVLAFVVEAVVDVVFASHPTKPWETLAARKKTNYK